MPPPPAGAPRRLGLDDAERVGPTEHLDLHDASFVDPFGLVAATCVGIAAAADGQRTYRLPADPEVADYCTRMGLVDTLGAVLRPVAAPTVTGARDRRHVLAELHPVASGVLTTSPVADLVYLRLDGRGGPAEDAFCCVAEACNNVSEHAGAAGVAAAQVYRRGRIDERVVLAIGDPGRGLAGSLADRHGPMDDRAAMEAVLQRAASATREVGTGLASMVTIVDETGGTLVVWSGDIMVRRHEKWSMVMKTSRLCGTVVGVELPCPPRGR